MNQLKKYAIIVQALYFILPFTCWVCSCQHREKLNGARCHNRLFDTEWKFKRGDIDQAWQPAFDDSEWRELTVPHDWNIEPCPVQDSVHIGPFVKGIKDSINTGHIPGGTGWYRNHFTLEPADAGKTVMLYFDGVSVLSDVWLNGHHLGFHPNGYTPFYYNLTPYLNPVGEKNVIAVQTVHTGDNSRWYPGAGIYRHVWLLVSRPIYIDPWGIYVTTPQVDSVRSQVSVAISVRNDTPVASEVVLNTTLFDPDGQVAGAFEHREACPEKNGIAAKIAFEVDNPQLWSPESPAMYTVEVKVMTDGEISDVKTVKFGIRAISFSAEKGFLLNGKATILRGACIHHDNGLLGSATYDRAEIRRVELLKQNGFNAIRTAHNPPSAQFLHACDSLGMMVIDEAFDMWVQTKWNCTKDYHLYFDEWSDRDLSAMILRDRNHPSIILWSIGNEIDECADSTGLAIAERLVKVAKSLDATRPVSQAIFQLWKEWDVSIPVFDLLDAGCYNYVWEHYERDHRKHPERVMIGTESFPRDAYVNRKMAEEKTYVIGDFVWTGMDYIGEVGIGNTRYGDPGETMREDMPWPWYLSWCGDLDICGDKKPQSCYRDVVWGRSDMEVMVHSPIPEGKVELFSRWGWPDEYPHWNWTGYEHVPLQVSVYTNCDTVCLYLNSEKVDTKAVTSSFPLTAVFTVPYHAGELKAVGFRNGKEVTSKTLVTTGKPAKIQLTAERNAVLANPNDLAYIKIEITDTAGRLVPDATVTVHLSVENNGSLIACGNAAPDDMQSFRNPICTTFRGRALAILQPTIQSGKMTLTAKADGFPEAKIEVFTGNQRRRCSGAFLFAERYAGRR